MMCMRYLIVVTIFSLALTSCSNNKYANPDIPNISSFSQKELEYENYKYAIRKLESLSNRSSSDPYTQQAQIALIYVYYKSANFLIARNSIDRFLRLNPLHPHVDYILYIRGLTNMALDKSILQNFFFLDDFNRSPEHARAALRDFTKLIRVYPKSHYVIDAKKHLMFIKNRLAEHELSIVKYYNKRGAYVAVVNRVEEMLHDFPDSNQTRLAFPYMEKAYRELQLDGQAEKIKKIIEEK